MKKTKHQPALIYQLEIIDDFLCGRWFRIEYFSISQVEVFQDSVFSEEE